MKIILFLIASSLAIAGCGADQSNLNRRATEWKFRADREIPAGRSIDEVNAWAAKYGFVFLLLEKQKQLHAIVERVPESGLNKFVCSEWSIILKVNLTASGTTANNEIIKVGTCL